MKYLEALDLTNNFQSNNKIKINLITSFFSNPLNIFLKAFFVKKNIDITIFNNPFNTLKQTLISLNLEKKNNVLILSPWDFCEKLNWRMGLNNKIEYFNDTN